jgi:DNA-directed RNA polymerase specialized sigma24 family protein
MAERELRDRWDRTLILAVPVLNFLGADVHPADLHPYRTYEDYDSAEGERTPEEFLMRHMEKMKLLPADQRRAVEEYYQKHGKHASD